MSIDGSDRLEREVIKLGRMRGVKGSSGWVDGEMLIWPLPLNHYSSSDQGFFSINGVPTKRDQFSWNDCLSTGNRSSRFAEQSPVYSQSDGKLSTRARPFTDHGRIVHGGKNCDASLRDRRQSRADRGKSFLICLMTASTLRTGTTGFLRSADDMERKGLISSTELRKLVQIAGTLLAFRIRFIPA
jgi:hypothetical protein